MMRNVLKWTWPGTVLVTALLLVGSSPSRAQTIEGFEPPTTISDFTPVGIPTATITPAAAHDGAVGLHFSPSPPEWLWRDYGANDPAPGDTIDAFARFDGSADGRIYIGVGATSTGTMSMVLGGNTSQLILERNASFSVLDLATTPFVFQPDVWYRVEMIYGAGSATVNLYSDTGSTVLASVNSNSTGFSTAGGLAFRGFNFFGTGTDIDTVFRPQASSVPEPSSIAFLFALAIPGSLIARRRNR